MVAPRLLEGVFSSLYHPPLVRSGPEADRLERLIGKMDELIVEVRRLVDLVGNPIDEDQLAPLFQDWSY